MSRLRPRNHRVSNPSRDAVAIPRAISTSRGPRPINLDLSALQWALGLAAFAGVLWALRGVWVTFIFVGTFTFLGAGIVERLERRGVPRAGGAAVFIAAAGLVLVLLSMLVIPTLVRELSDLFRKVPEALHTFDEWLKANTSYQLPTTIAELSERASDELVNQVTSFLKAGGAAMGRGAVGILSGVGSAVGALGTLVMIPVLTFFVLTELPGVYRVAAFLAPAGIRRFARHHRGALREALGSLIRGQLTVAGMMAVLYAVGLSIAGVPLAIAIAILSGIAYVIPFASATVCVALSAVFVLLEVQEGVVVPLVGAVITAVVVQLVEGWILTPRVVGGEAGLSPLAVIVAVLVFGTLFGFLGVLFALPVATAVGVILREGLADAAAKDGAGA